MQESIKREIGSDMKYIHQNERETEKRESHFGGISPMSSFRLPHEKYPKTIQLSNSENKTIVTNLPLCPVPRKVAKLCVNIWAKPVTVTIADG